MWNSKLVAIATLKEPTNNLQIKELFTENKINHPEETVPPHQITVSLYTKNMHVWRIFIDWGVKFTTALTSEQNKKHIANCLY